MELITYITIGFIIGIISVMWVVKYFNDSQNHPLIDRSTLNKNQGYTSLKSNFSEMIDLEGIALTDLKPSGYIQIDNQKYDAQSEGDFIDKDDKIIIIGFDSNFFIVKKIKKNKILK